MLQYWFQLYHPTTIYSIQYPAVHSYHQLPSPSSIPLVILPSLEVMLLLYLILGKYSPAELICFLHQWLATSPLSFSLSDWEILEAERSRAQSRAAVGTPCPTITHISRHPFWEITGFAYICVYKQTQPQTASQQHTLPCMFAAS